MPAQIYKLTLDQIQDEHFFTQILSKDITNNYYWCDDWSEELYVELAKKGFVSTTYDTKDGLVLLPELQYEYGILDFKNLHISKKVQKLIKEDKYTLSFNTKFEEVISELSKQHKYNWLKDEYVELLNNLYLKRDNTNAFKIYAVELIDKDTKELIAGEIGYSIGKTYTSLSGFSDKDKKYNNCGKLQLVLLSQHLQNKGFSFWNLGHPHMEYKKKLGSISYKREIFLRRWEEATKHNTIEI